MQSFASEFNSLKYVIEKSHKILLVAHNSPDADTTGSVFALKRYIESLGKVAVAACFDPVPEYLLTLVTERFEIPESLDLKVFDVVIATDSVERGFNKILDKLNENQLIVLMDHHPDIGLKGDITIIDSTFSSVCEIIYRFFEFNNIKIDKDMAAFLMLGILGDTGSFQHSNTTGQVMEIASQLLKRGALIPKIVNIIFANKKLSTLKLWGRAFSKAKINPKNGMIVTVLTQKDIEECEASSEDISQVASVLNTVPGTKFSLILSEKEEGAIKGSLRSENYKGVDVSEIAHQFGGGGHRLASGFEVKGKIVETEEGWEIV
jgi:bifunctional oligoribonuclease and PAP phosphatase NrnA